METRWTGSTSNILEISAATGLGMDSGMWNTPAEIKTHANSLTV
jgi:hypothetical protein